MPSSACTGGSIRGTRRTAPYGYYEPKVTFTESFDEQLARPHAIETDRRC
jgi:hypothetical protein